MTIFKNRFAHTTFWIFTLTLRFRQNLDIRILRKHWRFTVEKLALNSDSKKIAVLAIYPRGHLLNSTLRLINQLVSNGYRVVAVINEGTSKHAEYLLQLNLLDITVLSRPNIGRDFGAYKLGIQYIQNLPSYDSFERLVLANDSMYYFPSSTEFLSKLLKESDPWIGMFVNYQFHIHAQSFFLSFDRSVFSSKNFTDFWSKYFPTNIRNVIIKKGEVKLTSVLMDSDFTPSPYVKASLIENSQKLDSFKIEDKFALWGGFSFIDVELSPSSFEIHRLQFRRIFEILNPSHHVGMIATRILGAPLKLDLLRTGLATLNDLVETAFHAGVENHELKEFEIDYTAGGSNSSCRGFHKLWRTYGLE